MRKATITAILMCVLLEVHIHAAQPGRFVRASRPKAGEYIVILQPTLTRDEVPGIAKALSAAHHATLRGIITSAANGFFVTMGEAQARALSNNPHVVVVEENGYLEMAPTVPTTNWHLDRIDTQGLNGSYSYCETGNGVYVYVVDTGVAKSHAEFQTTNGSKVLNGVSFANDWHPHPDDPPGTGDVGTNPCGGFTYAEGTTNGIIRTYNGGHGTSVASLIAGNTLGVAPDAKIVPVKVGSCPPAGSPANQNIVIETEHMCWGLDWIVGPNNPYRGLGPRVVNMSIYQSATTPLAGALEAVITGVIAGGSCGRPICLPGHEIPVIVAANNQDGSACNTTPARMAYGNSGYTRHTITVGGTRANDTRWDCIHTEATVNCSPNDPGSNYGECVDIYAPAHDINSASLFSPTAIRTLYPARSGTSFAAPIVSGIVAQMLQWNSSLGADGVWSQLYSWGVTLPNSTDPDGIGAIRFARGRACSP